MGELGGSRQALLPTALITRNGAALTLLPDTPPLPLHRAPLLLPKEAGRQPCRQGGRGRPTAAAGTAGQGALPLRLFLLSSVKARSSGAESASGGKGSTGDPPRPAVPAPAPQSAVVFSQQERKSCLPKTVPAPQLPSLRGEPVSGPQCLKGPQEEDPGLWLSAGGLAGSPSGHGRGQPCWEAARAGARRHLPRAPGQSASAGSRPPNPRGQRWGQAQVLGTRPRTELPATSLSLPLGYTPENIL